MKTRNKAQSLNLNTRRSMKQGVINMRFVAPTVENPNFGFTGYAVKWDSVNDYGERFVKGAFADQIASSETIHMYYNHGWRAWYGKDEHRIGKWLEIIEDDIGLKVSGELTAGLFSADQIKAMMQHGTVNGLSICFYEVDSSDYTFDYNVKVISKARMYEISVVDEPADYSARIDSEIEDALEEIDSVDQAVEVLGRCGMSPKAARSIVNQLAKNSSSKKPSASADVARSSKLQQALHLLKSK
jgi:HK97 family phage prohead protease